MTVRSATWPTLEQRLEVVGIMAETPNLALPDGLREALYPIAGTTTDTERTRKIVLLFIEAAIEMVHAIATASPKSSPLGQFIDLPQDWQKDQVSARAIAWRVSSMSIEQVGVPMFTALQGVYEMLSSCFAIVDADISMGDISHPIEELIARLALLITIYEEAVDPQVSSVMSLRLLAAATTP